MLLSDIEMPRMDGFDLARNMRADPRLADLPVIMITSRIAQKHATTRPSWVSTTTSASRTPKKTCWRWWRATPRPPPTPEGGRRPAAARAHLAGMSQVVDHLAELTGFRDRDVLDTTLVAVLRDLLQPLVGDGVPPRR